MTIRNLILGKSKRSSFGYLIFLLLFCLSCTEVKENRGLYIQQKYEYKVRQYVQQRRNQCQLETFEKIHQEVDSMMYFLVQKKRQKNPEMPERPIRPARLVDSIVLESNQ